ncbi:MAG: hypothetical protein LIO79_07090 [Rikenellaceae bacterium]|nr:hypothetical protein [Rikenellaceae bacterium]
MLIVQFDDGSTNTILMGSSFLNIPNSPGSGTPGRRLSADAPGFIRNGPFGSADTTVVFTIADDTWRYITRADAAANNTSPVLVAANNNNNVCLGIDLDRRIVYCGDVDTYRGIGTNLTTGPTVTGDADKVIANIWAWIAETVLLVDEE